MGVYHVKMVYHVNRSITLMASIMLMGVYLVNGSIMRMGVCHVNGVCHNRLTHMKGFTECDRPHHMSDPVNMETTSSCTLLSREC